MYKWQKLNVMKFTSSFFTLNSLALPEHKLNVQKRLSHAKFGKCGEKVASEVLISKMKNWSLHAMFSETLYKVHRSPRKKENKLHLTYAQTLSLATVS